MLTIPPLGISILKHKPIKEEPKPKKASTKKAPKKTVKA